MRHDLTIPQFIILVLLSIGPVTLIVSGIFMGIDHLTDGGWFTLLDKYSWIGPCLNGGGIGISVLFLNDLVHKFWTKS
jgi:hypothetical protein